MKHEAEIKELLVKNAIHLIAQGGFESATTKELTHCSGSIEGLRMNEVYIYRLYGSKEALYEAMFAYLDKEMYLVFREAIEAAGGMEPHTEQKLFQIFSNVWQFIMENEEHCRCYVRYYYSIYFKGQTFDTQQMHFNKLIAEFAPLFKAEADVNAIMRSVFVALMDFGLQVHNGMLENREDNRQHVFLVLHSMMRPYFKDSIKQ